MSILVTRHYIFCNVPFFTYARSAAASLANIYVLDFDNAIAIRVRIPTIKKTLSKSFSFSAACISALIISCNLIASSFVIVSFLNFVKRKP